ncbi:hypothetical protein [Streptomyces sp. WMMB303]|uniref:hypothetical protein n=1 Tax=Streptomyces sp. WMMB303 TaxID=3034154 RepID=UPI0023EAE317|nr:hypothetical protein [Streptomyces sp. WMMB303]MDF4254329.1 hypothetical protein [Streptomyces sp. WMMB303]
MENRLKKKNTNNPDVWTAIQHRTAAELKERWRTLKHVTLSPSRIGDIARTALVLNGHWK